MMNFLLLCRAIMRHRKKSKEIGYMGMIAILELIQQIIRN